MEDGRVDRKCLNHAWRSQAQLGLGHHGEPSALNILTTRKLTGPHPYPTTTQSPTWGHPGSGQGCNRLRPIAAVTCLGKVYVFSVNCTKILFEAKSGYT